MNGSPEFLNENQENTLEETCGEIVNDTLPSEIVNVSESNQVVEKSQNDHLNKRLLCSFMEKLNQTQVEACEDSVANVENENDEFEDK